MILYVKIVRRYHLQHAEYVRALRGQRLSIISLAVRLSFPIRCFPIIIFPRSFSSKISSLLLFSNPPRAPSSSRRPTLPAPRALVRSFPPPFSLHLPNKHSKMTSTPPTFATTICDVLLSRTQSLSWFNTSSVSSGKIAFERCSSNSTHRASSSDRTFPHHPRRRLVRCLLVGEVTRDDFQRGRCTEDDVLRRGHGRAEPHPRSYSQRGVCVSKQTVCARFGVQRVTVSRERSFASLGEKKVIARFIVYPRVYGENTIARKTRVSTQFTKMTSSLTLLPFVPWSSLSFLLSKVCEDDETIHRRVFTTRTKAVVKTDDDANAEKRMMHAR